ncbi:ABC transporter substrate-binding protein [bacterium]|nr:ABC transporter substrate-binding protein [bacterium]
MLVNRRLFTAALLVLSLEFLTLSSATAAVDEGQIEQATAVVEKLHSTLVSVATQQNLDFEQRVEKLDSVVRNSFDFAYISRFLLRRTWTDLAAEEQQRFIDIFERLSVASYASRFAEVSAESLVINESQVQGENRVQVIASVMLEDRDVPLSYLLQPVSDEPVERWVIVNVMADGVSDLALRRAEYSRVLADENFEGLLDHVAQQIEALNP